MKKILFLLFISMNYQGFSQIKDSLIKVTDNYYMITGLGANVSFLVTDNGVLVVDAGMYFQAGDLVKSRIKSITTKPIKYLVYTHYHFDHVFGTSALSNGAIVIAHKNVVKNLNTYDSIWLDHYKHRIKVQVERSKFLADSLRNLNSLDYIVHENDYLYTKKELELAKNIKVIYPDVVFEGEINFTLGNDTVNLYYPGYTHSDCSILVEFKNQNVLVAGDFLFYESMPYLPGGCSTSNWIEQLENYGKKKYSFVIPGHGPLSNYNALLNQAEYLTDVKKEVKKYIDEGKSLDQIISLVTMPKYSHFGLQHLLKSEIEAIYSEYSSVEN